jgi:leucine dehydrogenase
MPDKGKAMLTKVEFSSHEQVYLLDDPSAGLSGTIALHSTALGPAAGGCRIWNYASRDEQIADALRLSKGMTYKNAIARLPLGGGKAVLSLAPDADRKRALSAYGRAVEELGGSYITAEDVGSSVSDMEIVRHKTRYVSGLPVNGGSLDAGGDPSPWTALGVFLSIQYAVRRKLGRELNGVRVAVQGLGGVGGALCRLLSDAGAKLVVADINYKRALVMEAVNGARIGHVATIHSEDVDVYAPCALGGALSAETVPQLRAAIICGGANNQLADDAISADLDARNILYAPDFVVNGGGIMNVAAQWLGESRASVDSRVNAIPRTLAHVFDKAEAERIPTATAAVLMAERLVAQAERVAA